MLTDVAREAGERSLEAGADDYMPKRIDDSIMRIRVNLHLHLGALGAPEASLPAGPAPILVASATSQLRAQITNQFTRDGHTVRGVETLQELQERLAPEDRVLVLDLGLGFTAVHEFLIELRHAPGTRHLPVLLIASKEEVKHLESLEHLVDDVLWTPLKAKVFSQRLAYMLKLGHRGR
jgi:DNA-binding response OmpR family regulator